MNIRNLDLNLIVILNDLNKTLSVTKTAKNLGLSQPAVSHALNRLRQSLDDELFVRGQRKLVATEYAKNLLDPINDILSHLESSLFGQVEWSPSESDRNFTLSGTSYDANILFPNIIKNLESTAPNLHFLFKGIVIDKYLERMINGEVDLSFAGDLTHFPNFEIETLGEWDFCLITAKSNKGVKKHISLDEYLSAKHVLYCPTDVSGSEVDKVLARKGHKRDISIETSYLESIPRIVSSGRYLSLVPRFYGNAIKIFYPVRVLEPPFQVNSFKHQMIWHKSKSSDVGHIWLRDYIRTNYKKFMSSLV